MLNKSSNLVRIVIALTLTIWLSSAGIAQSKPAPAGKAPADKPPVEKKTKAANESCDGALDIVPSKPMTFVRKRRPSAKETKPSAPTADPADAKSPGKEPKSDQQQSGR